MAPLTTATQQDQVGLYAWGGPGTIRLIKAKYHSPKIDEASFLSLYDQRTLAQIKEKFHVTDAWVSYSWGFSEQTEQEDYRFLRQRLPNFQRLNIRTHAYVQGFNLITAEFMGQDLFCRDPRGHLLPYSKSRSYTCPNNPYFQQLFLKRVAQASQEAVSGVFVDNIIFGLPPLVVKKRNVSWFGCACQWCQKTFTDRFHEELPTQFHNHSSLKKYLAFRNASVLALVSQASQIARQAGKTFGVNLYDPSLHQSEFYLGFHFAELEPWLDYYLVENHALSGYKKKNWLGNQRTVSFFSNLKKPLFIVSYDKGIGQEKKFTSQTIAAHLTDARHKNYFACIKATEFTTKKVWHALKPTDLAPVQIPSTQLRLNNIDRLTIKVRVLRSSTLFERVLMKNAERYYARVLRLFFEKHLVHRLFKPLFYSPKVLKQARLYSSQDIFED